MTTIYDAIKNAQSAFAEKLGADPFNVPPHLQSEDEACRQLDAKLAKEFEEPIKMLQDGLICAVEFFEMIYIAATKPAL